MANTSNERTSASDLKDIARGQMECAGHAAEGVADRVAEQGRQASQGIQDVAGNITGAVDKSLKERPMATLAMAAALGFVLGALWKT